MDEWDSITSAQQSDPASLAVHNRKSAKTAIAWESESLSERFGNPLVLSCVCVNVDVALRGNTDPIVTADKRRNALK